MKMAFRRAVYKMPQFKRFSNLDNAKKLSKESSVPNFIVYFTQMKALIFSLKHIKSKLQMAQSTIRLIQYLTFFCYIKFLLFSFN